MIKKFLFTSLYMFAALILLGLALSVHPAYGKTIGQRIEQLPSGSAKKNQLPNNHGS
jgi:hypothetical protein